VADGTLLASFSSSPNDPSILGGVVSARNCSLWLKIVRNTKYLPLMEFKFEYQLRRWMAGGLQVNFAAQM
jgi:hypothetical protein